MTKRVYIWEFPVRLTHWLNVLAILVLSFTGIYIGSPFLHVPPGEHFVFTTIKFIHIVAAYVFTLSCLIRVYWAFAGNPYSRWIEFFPFSARRRKEVIECVKFYLFLRKSPPFAAGHSASAVLSYLAAFFLYLVEIVTGFALYSQSHAGFIQVLMGGWVLGIVSSPILRLIHHLAMWLLLIFAAVHLYIAWLNDIAEKQFVMSSIFGGYKGLDEE